LSGAVSGAGDVALAGRSPAVAGAAQQLLNAALFVTVLTSSLVFIEPAPHDALMFVLLAMGIAARVPFDRKLVPLLLLLTVWLVGGLLSLIQVGDQQKPIQYVATSAYLGVAALLFACLFSDGDRVRLSILRRGYLLAALIAAAAGYVGFFHLLPGSNIFLDFYEGTTIARVSSTFKDPNVYGPFLVFPLLILMLGFLTRGITLGALALTIAMLGGVLLSFSRGAWFHFAVSAVAAVAILYAVTPDPRMRGRIVMLGSIAAAAMLLLVVAMLSISSVHDIFLERAKAIQPYDVGPGGRFWLQKIALGAILEHPNGMGPFEFARIYGGQQHDVYMEGFLVYGWLGGAAYLAIVLVTLGLGLRTVHAATPWQTYLIAAYAAFVGEAFEGFIIDTDHWRHFFLLLGMSWGLSIATINDRRRQRIAALHSGLY